MNGLLAILKRFVAEWRLQRQGRRALGEIHFAKYRIMPGQNDRPVEERVLRGLPQRLQAAPWRPLTSC